ncbi:MAG: NUDIX hydrolase [Candidatus Paceibacterota bacterium]
MKKRRVICRAVVLDKQQESILLVRNKNANFWYPPGGGLESGESLSDCITREILEETGLEATLDRFLYLQEFSPNSTEVYLEMFWLAYPKNGSVLPKVHLDNGGIVAESRWFFKTELSSLELFPERLKKQLWDDLEKLLCVPNQFLNLKKGG